MQVNFNSTPLNNTNFKGFGYKTARLGEAYVKNYSPDPVRDAFVKTVKKGNPFVKLAQKIGLIDAPAKDTTVIRTFQRTLSGQGQNDTYKAKEVMRKIENELNLKINDRLFCAQTRDAFGHPKVIFNGFFENVQGEPSVRIFELLSEQGEMTPTQLSAFKLFHDGEMRRLMSKGTQNNPLIRPNTMGADTSSSISNKIKSLARQIEVEDWEEISSPEKLMPVMFSADGKKALLHQTK